LEVLRFNKEDLLTGDSSPSLGYEQEMLPKMLDYLIEFHYKEVNEKEFSGLEGQKSRADKKKN